MKIVLDTASFVTAVRSSGGAAGEVMRRCFVKKLVLMDFKLELLEQIRSRKQDGD